MIEKSRKKIMCPPVIKLLIRGYIIIGVILGLEITGIFTNISVIIFSITVISISMVFGIGYMLAIQSGPVRKSSFDIPNTVLFYVKSSMIIYFVILTIEFGLLLERIGSVLIFMIASIMIMAGTLSYVYEVLQRTRPVPKRRPLPKKMPRRL